MARGARWSVLLGLLALAALIAPFTAALSRNDLYQYMGPGALALESDPNGMLMSAEATLKTPIAFYDKIYNSIFVSTESILRSPSPNIKFDTRRLLLSHICRH